jgi:hypothetical protein
MVLQILEWLEWMFTEEFMCFRAGFKIRVNPIPLKVYDVCYLYFECLTGHLAFTITLFYISDPLTLQQQPTTKPFSPKQVGVG